MPASRSTRASTSHDVSASMTTSRKRARDKENVAPRSFSALSRYDQDDQDDDQDAASASDRGDEDSFRASKSRRGAATTAKPAKTTKKAQSNSKGSAVGARKTASKSRRVEQLEDDDDEQGDDEEMEDNASIADTANGEDESVADDQDDTLRAVRTGAKSSGRGRTASSNGKAATAAPSTKSRSRAAAAETTEDGYGDEDDAAAGTDAMLLERKEFDSWMEKKLAKMASKRERALEDKLQRMTEERDEIQNQLDELRQLRNTKAEETLEALRKAAETRHKHDKDLINSLKARAEAAERRAREAEANGGGAADRSMSIVGMRTPSVASTSNAPQVEELEKRHRKEMAEAAKVQRKLEDDVNKYKAKLEEEIATSKALLEKAHLGSSASTSSSQAAGKGRAATELALTAQQHEDEKAIRRLYEDLTGLVVTGVETYDAKEKYKRFKMLFANDAYHSLVFTLEEFEALFDPPAGSRSTQKVKREQFCYEPQLDEDRDRAFLEADVPEMWHETIRFHRDMAFPFFNKLKGALRLGPSRSD
ncbi:uncharacterized protein PFL1_01046 [Pseudozyma flocculosa PF-1]|uniref:Monopolin complex subunit Csm1/Pcs1 C-terminal domain-containing protein n=1 Tax=Pseudozyma flocculosa TaxID=84751 RepID=A0A5C3FBH2_9BASI|nr:uncharacterized protein PFL1_01046 [Pseudozyma flocculosa PF-1]EPQ31713.1 hypothetical protein PFL1_01046 [Pseudozyma flocculosa PF-1]SPO40831.1 uncharacterized protein PSFLO_06313 [Pseudozyma flocculosa]